MAEARFSIGQVNITDYLRVIAREVTSPLAEVSNVVYPPPQPTSRNIVITGLNPVMHYFDFYESADGIAQGTLLATFTIDVGLINLTAIEFIEFVVGRGEANDPAAGSDTYTNTALDGADYQVTQRGVGPRSFEDEIELVPGGGFKFQAATGETFNNQDRWFITVSNTTTTRATVTARGWFTDVVEVTSDITLSSTHYNCMMEANAGGTILTITIPNIASIPEDTFFGFNTHYGDQRYLALQLQSGESVRFKNALKNILWLGKSEDIIIVKKGSLLKVLDDGTDYKRVGLKVKGDLPPINGLAETGGWYDIADYPRFFYEYVNQIPLASLSTFTGDDVDEPTKFAIDNSGARFWMRDTGGYFERNVDPDGNIDTYRSSGDRYAGTAQSDMIKKHKHINRWGDSHDTPSTGATSNQGHFGSNASDFDNYWFFSGDGTNDVAGNTNAPNADGVIGDETRGVNVAEFSYRII